MSARKKESVERSPASDSRMTFTEFLRQFPTNDACLDYLKARFYPDGTPCPKCGKPSRFHKINGRSAYSCQHCGHHVYPTAGTIFHKSTTSLQLWFWAIYLISSTRVGISAKQLEREIGVSNKTALRMFRQIRALMTNQGGPLSGKVEVDETAYGGKPRAGETKKYGKGRKGGSRWTAKKKTTVFGMVERGGQVRAKVVPSRGGDVLKATMRQYVLPASMIFTDEFPLYLGTSGEYQGHKRIRHR